MRAPAYIKHAFPDDDKAKKARDIFRLEFTRGHLTEYASVEQARKSSYNPPKRYYLKLLALNELGGFHGIESGETVSTGEWFEYLNAGDTYAPTVIYWRGNFRIQSVGDFIERVGVKFK